MQEQGSPVAALRPGQVRPHRLPVLLPPGEARQSRSSSLVTVASETGPGPVGPTLSTLQLSPLPWGQSSPLLSRVLSNCSHLPRSSKFFLLKHSSSPYRKQRRPWLYGR